MASKPRTGEAEGDTGVATVTRKQEQLKKPPLYQVLFHNDNYTTMEFVVWVLQTIFHRSESESVTIMLFRPSHRHRRGRRLHQRRGRDQDAQDPRARAAARVSPQAVAGTR